MTGIPHAGPERMAEFNDWKFGLMIHFGPWSQTGRAKTWDIVRTPEAERDPAWETLHTTFDPQGFDPSAWARAAKGAGMNYCLFTTKHHDGFCNWPTKTTDYSVAGADCPVSRWEDPDIVRRVADAMRAEGLRYGHYYSHIDWHEPVAQAFSMQHPLYDPDAVQNDPEGTVRPKFYTTFERLGR